MKITYRSRVNSSTRITCGTQLKRIARYNEFNNGHVLFDYKKMSDEEAEEQARQASIKDPTDVYYVHYDDVMNPDSDYRWINGKRYHYSQVPLNGKMPDNVESATSITGTWQMLDHKSVPDSDGFNTDYTLYTDNAGKYICMLGDNEAYEPDENYADWEGDSEAEAYEWFDSYAGLVDDNEDIYSATNVGETYDCFCTDCDTVTPQTYKGTTNSGEDMYICQRCGCENYESGESIESATDLPGTTESDYVEDHSGEVSAEYCESVMDQIVNDLNQEGYKSSYTETNHEGDYAITINTRVGKLTEIIDITSFTGVGIATDADREFDSCMMDIRDFVVSKDPSAGI